MIIRQVMNLEILEVERIDVLNGIYFLYLGLF
jgi:hypothetical protein